MSSTRDPSDAVAARARLILALLTEAEALVASGQAPSVPHALVALGHAAAREGSPAPDADELFRLYHDAYGVDIDLVSLLIESRTVCQRGLTPVELLRDGDWPLLRHCVGALAGGTCA